MTSDDDQQNVSRFFTEVGIIQQLISTKLESLLPGRMSATQFGILGHLSRRPDGETPLQLSNAFQVPKTSMTHMLSVLQKLEFVTIEPHPHDGRSKVARATEKGQQFLQQCLMQMGKELAPVMSTLTAQPFTEALPHLQRIREALDAERDQ
jgi:DNA-binding MarR family transcriptional regulator